MKTNELIKKAIEQQKANFEKGFGLTEEIQQKVEEKTLKTLEEAKYLPEQGREFVKQWLLAVKTGRETLKNWVEKGYAEIEHSLAGIH